MLALFISALIITTPTAFAQIPGANIGGAVKGAETPPSEARPVPKSPETPVIIQQEEKPLTLPEGRKLLVKDFKIEGALKRDGTKLSALLAPYKGKELTMAEINQAADKVTLFYRDKGYLVAKAYVPKQDASGGTLVIKVVLGKYGKFSLKNNSHVKDSIVQGVFDRTKKTSEDVTRDSLERSMLLVRDMPGAKMPTVTVAPGAAPGTSDFDVSVDPAQRFNGYAMLDNQGSRYTGKNRAYAGFDTNSPFGIADKLSLSAMTTNGNDLENGRAAYSLPLGYSGLRFELAAARTKYSLGGIYTPLSATGSANIYEGTLSYPLKRTRSESIDVSLNFAYKQLRDNLSAVQSTNPRGDSVVTLAVQRGTYGTLFGRDLFTTLTGSVAAGSIDIQDPTQKAMNQAGANTGGSFWKVNAGFFGNLTLNTNWSLRSSLKVQKALTDTNLDVIEQMFISGTTGVKSYTELIGGDNGYVANMECRYNLPSFSSMKHALGLFADNGWVYAQQGSYTTLRTKTMLSDLGVGYYINFRQAFGSLQVAQPIGQTHNNIESNPGTRILMQVGASF